MLIRFKASNFRSFREPMEFSMKASSNKEHPENTKEQPICGKLLKSAAIFGANAAGKSNLIRAITAALIIIRTSETRQVNELIPFVEPFAFCKETKETSFEFEFTMDESRYIYGFSCTQKKITEEHLTAYNSQRPAKIFKRTAKGYEFYSNEAQKQLMPLTERTTPNKLFIASATVWNASLTKEPYLWLSSYIDVFDSNNPMLHSLELYEKDKSGKLRSFTNNLLKEADINISNFTVEAKDINNPPPFMMNMPVPSIRKEYIVRTEHIVRTDGDNHAIYQLPLPAESKGTQNLFFLSPWIKKALDKGYVFCVDELDSSMHPALLLYIVNLFNSPETNPKGAQLIMTSHTTDLLSTSIMRRDQIFFVEKDNNTGLSDLYSLNDFPARTREDIRKAYIAGRFGAVPNIL